MHAVTLSYLTLCDPMDWSPPGSSVHGVFQAKVLEWVAFSFCTGSSQPRDRTHVSHVSLIGKSILYHWATCPLTGIQRPLPMMWVGTEWQEDSVLMGKWSIKLNRYLFIFGFHYNISQGFLNAWSQFSYTSSVNLSRTLFTKNLGDSVSQSAICRIPKTLTDPPGDKHTNKQKPETDRSKLL